MRSLIQQGGTGISNRSWGWDIQVGLDQPFPGCLRRIVHSLNDSHTMDEVLNYSKDVTAVTLLQGTMKLHKPYILWGASCMRVACILSKSVKVVFISVC